MPRHHHIWSLEDEGLEVCIDCGRTRRVTVSGPQLEECRCGRGVARFWWHDETVGSRLVCGDCFTEVLREVTAGAA